MPGLSTRRQSRCRLCACAGDDRRLQPGEIDDEAGHLLAGGVALDGHHRMNLVFQRYASRVHVRVDRAGCTTLMVMPREPKSLTSARRRRSCGRSPRRRAPAGLRRLRRGWRSPPGCRGQATRTSATTASRSAPSHLTVLLPVSAASASAASCEPNQEKATSPPSAAKQRPMSASMPRLAPSTRMASPEIRHANRP